MSQFSTIAGLVQARYSGHFPERSLGEIKYDTVRLLFNY